MKHSSAIGALANQCTTSTILAIQEATLDICAAIGIAAVPRSLAAAEVLHAEAGLPMMRCSTDNI